jgi:urease accessory protein
MVEIRARVFVHRDQKAAVRGRLELPFDRRTKTRQRVTIDSGEEMAVMLPRGEVLRGGDLVATDDGRLIQVVASPEAVLHVTCATPRELACAAYHLGNRHVAVEVGDGYLRLAADHVLKEMLEGLGATIVEMNVAFEPEAGAYGGGHSHGHDHDDDHEHDPGHEHGPKIHHYGSGHE